MNLFKKSKKYVKFKKKLKENLELLKKSRDIASISYFTISLIIYGFIINLGLLILGVNIKILNILSLGASYWFIENKLVPLFRRLWFRK